MRYWIMTGMVVLAMVAANVAPGQAADPDCTAVMVDWEPLRDMVRDSFEALEADAFQGMEHVFVQRGDCLKHVPIPWRMLPSAEVLSQKMVQLVQRPLRLGQADFVRGFLAGLNKAKLIRGFERITGKRSARLGCTEVVLELKEYGGVYALSVSHLHRVWEECPVKFTKKARGRSEIITTGVRVQ